MDIAASAILAGFPLLLGLAVLVTQEPRRALSRADADVVSFIVIPAALCLLIVLPLAMLYRLSGVLADRRESRATEHAFPPSAMAGAGRRFAALTIDWMPAWALVVGLTDLVTATLGEDAPLAILYFAVLPLSFALPSLPFMLRRGRRRGQSLGKQLLRIRVVDAEGEPLRTSQILVRELLTKSLLLFGISALLIYLPLLVDLAMTRRDPQRRAIEDRIAGTRVVGASVALFPEPVAAEAPRALVAA